MIQGLKTTAVNKRLQLLRTLLLLVILTDFVPQITIPVAVMLSCGVCDGNIMRALSECSKVAKICHMLCAKKALEIPFQNFGHATGNSSLSELSIQSVSPEGVYGQYSIVYPMVRDIPRCPTRALPQLSISSLGL